jgi:hypothetical protein
MSPSRPTDRCNRTKAPLLGHRQNPPDTGTTATFQLDHPETVGIPAFYVVVNFREVPEEDFLVGGEPVGNFIRIFVDHVARQMDPPALRRWASDEFEKALVPHVKDRGFDWEWHIDETPIDLLRTQGLVPPPESDIEKLWGQREPAHPRRGRCLVTKHPGVRRRRTPGHQQEPTRGLDTTGTAAAPAACGLEADPRALSCPAHHGLGGVLGALKKAGAT